MRKRRKDSIPAPCPIEERISKWTVRYLRSCGVKVAVCGQCRKPRLMAARRRSCPRCSGQAIPLAQSSTRNRRVTHDGQALTLTEWAKVTGLRRDAIYDRLKHGWSVEKALSTPTAREMRQPSVFGELKINS